MTDQRLPNVAYRRWLDDVANGVRGFDTAPSDVLVGPPGPAPPPPAPPPPTAQRAWRPLGPFAIPHGQTKTDISDLRPPVAGRVSAIAVDPSDATHLLAGAGGGGVWESHNSGATWAPRSDAAPSLAIGAIAFDPAAPATVYAGTGEGNALSYLGAGLLRSTDGGQRWAVRHAPTFAGDAFFDLKLDPENPQHLLAGTVRGLYESTNGGAAWTQRRAATTWSVSFHPAVVGTPGLSQEVFAACSDGIFRSANGGTAWAAVPVPGAPAAWVRSAIAHAPSAPDVVWIFGAGVNPAPPPNIDGGHLARRGGPHPAAFAAVPLPAAVTPATMQQAFYDWVLAVAPETADTIYLGTVDLWRIDRSSVTGAVVATAVSPKTPGESVHADQHAFALPPGAPGTIYVGNDGGVFRSTDSGVHWQALNRGLSILEIEYLAQHPQVDAWLLAGTQDNGSERYEGTGTWYHVSDGDGGDCAVNEDAPATVFHERFSVPNRQEVHNLRSRASGGWDTWLFTQTAPAGHPTLFYAPMEARGAMLVQAGQDVFVSDTEGAAGSFARVTIPPAGPPAPPNPDVVSAIDVASADRIVVGTALGRMFALARNAAPPPAWNVVALGALPNPQMVTDVLTAPDNPRRIWVTCAGPAISNIARSDDGGATFVSAVGTLPAGLHSWAIAADPANPPTVFAGTDRGVFRSTDLGATWTVVGAGLPNCQVKDLVFQPFARALRAGTKSRGVWELEVDLPPAAGPDVYVRYHPVDSGRALPPGTAAPVETPDPFTPTGAARWWESPDVKVDAAPHLAAALGALEVDVFADDHGVAAAGLFDESPRSGQPARVYVQVHNRSAVDATAGVDVRIFSAVPSIGAPPLPAAFWTGWPANAPAGASPWQPIAAAARIATIEAGRARLAAFDWAVPADVRDAVTLMAVAVPVGTAFAPAPTTISELLAATNAIGIASKVALRPGYALPGPRPGAVLAFVHASTGVGDYTLEIDAGSSAMVVGAVLSTALSNLAGGAGAVPLVEGDHPALGELLAARPALGGQLDRNQLYVPPARGSWLGTLTLAAGDAEPLVLLITRPQPPRGRWSVVQRDAAGVVRGGLTLLA